MAEKRVKVTIMKRTGAVSIDATGFTGTSCREATATLEKLLGSSGTEEVKPEMHQEAVEQVTEGA